MSKVDELIDKYKHVKGFSVDILPEESDLTQEELSRLVTELNRDYVCIKFDNTHLKALRYFEEKYLPKIGDDIKREGNVYTSLGEGIYCYRYKEPIQFEKGRVAAILEGTVDFIEMIYDRFNNKPSEILIKPNKTIKVIDIIKENNTELNWNK